MPKNYSQNDPNWKNQLLGHNTSLPYTLGNYGCLITALANACDRLGVNTFNVGTYGNQELTPYWLDVNFTEFNNGYAPNGGDYIWGSLNKVVPEVIENDWIFRWQHSFNKFKQEIKSKIKSGKCQCIIELDFAPNTTTQDQHWVLIDSIDGDNVNIVDSWDGKVKPFSDYFGLTVGSPNDSIWCAKFISIRETKSEKVTNNIMSEQPNKKDKAFSLINSSEILNQADRKSLNDAVSGEDYEYLVGDNINYRIQAAKLQEQNSKLAAQNTDNSNDRVRLLDEKAKAEANAQSQKVISDRFFIEINDKDIGLKATVANLRSTIEANNKEIKVLKEALIENQKIVVKQGEILNSKPDTWKWLEVWKGVNRQGIIAFLSTFIPMCIAFLSSPQLAQFLTDRGWLVASIPIIAFLIDWLKKINN